MKFGIDIVLVPIMLLGLIADQRRSVSRMDLLPFGNIVIESLERDQDMTEGTRQRLLETIGNRRIVLIGEPAHYIAEVIDFKSRIIAELKHEGFHTLFLEVSVFDGYLIDKYVETGDENYLDKVWLLGHRSPHDWPIGERLLVDNTEWLNNSHRERRAFYQRLRQISHSRPQGSPRLKIVGYDLALQPVQALPVLRDLIRNFPTDQQLQEFMTAITQAFRSSPSESSNNINRIINSTSLREVINQMDWQIQIILQALSASIDLYPALAAMRSFYEVYETFSLRETYMMEIVARTLAAPPLKSSRVLFSGHNLHMSKDSRKIWYRSWSRTHAKRLPFWLSVGTFINSHFASDVTGIWMLFADGNISDPRCPQKSCSVQTFPDSWEQRVSKIIDDDFLWILGAQNASLETYFISDGRQLMYTDLPKQTDIVYFVQKVTPIGSQL